MVKKAIWKKKTEFTKVMSNGGRRMVISAASMRRLSSGYGGKGSIRTEEEFHDAFDAGLLDEQYQEFLANEMHLDDDACVKASDNCDYLDSFMDYMLAPPPGGPGSTK